MGYAMHPTPAQRVRGSLPWAESTHSRRAVLPYPLPVLPIKMLARVAVSILCDPVRGPHPSRVATMRMKQWGDDGSVGCGAPR
eukprot:gene2356-biopygen9076